VAVCGAMGRSVCRLKRALVEMSRHTETHAVIQGIDRTTLALLECEQCLPQCQSGATRSLTAGSDGPVGADGNRRILAFKEFLAATVCCRRARESFRDVYRVVRPRLVQFGQRRQTGRLIWRYQMVPVKAANRRDPSLGRDSLCPSRKGLLNVANGERILKRSMVAGPIPHEHNVIVIVD